MRPFIVFVWAATFCLQAAAALAGEPSGKRVNIDPQGLTQPAVFNHVVTTTGGTLVHIAGQTARGGDGKLVGRGDLQAQLGQVLKRLETTLAAAGATFEDVIRQRIYVVNMKQEDVAIIRSALEQLYPGENKPASTLVGVSALAEEGYLIEIDLTAHLP